MELFRLKKSKSEQHGCKKGIGTEVGTIGVMVVLVSQLSTDMEHGATTLLVQYCP